MATNLKEKNNFYLKNNTFKDLGHELSKDSLIMDFGCGNGENVQLFREAGFNAFGCDINFIDNSSKTTRNLIDDSIIKLIDTANYTLPFKDNTFDYIYSNSVFEHVQDYPSAISELFRILKPSGFCMHVFVSRYTLIEPHVKVPMATIIRNYYWLYFWATIGIRNIFQNGLTANETAKHNLNYLNSKTKYSSEKIIIKHFKASFENVSFIEDVLMKYSNRKYLPVLAKIFPFLPLLFRTFVSRIVFTSLPKK
jgi:ubiquinone/menaquinone biosynthesis C-methylase UbiE